MKYKIHAITPSGCVLPFYEENGELIGALPIETGDFEKAKEMLTTEAYERVLREWTDEKISARGIELERQAQIVD